MVCAKTILVVTVVDTNLDGDRRINETNDGGGNSDEVGVAAIRSTSESDGC